MLSYNKVIEIFYIADDFCKFFNEILLIYTRSRFKCYKKNEFHPLLHPLSRLRRDLDVAAA